MHSTVYNRTNHPFGTTWPIGKERKRKTVLTSLWNGHIILLLKPYLGVYAYACGPFAVDESPRRREGKSMSEVHLKDGESLENALKRFKRNCAKSGVLAEVRKRESYESPSVKRRKKSEAARKNKKKFY